MSVREEAGCWDSLPRSAGVSSRLVYWRTVGGGVWIGVCVPTQVSNEVDVRVSRWQAKFEPFFGRRSFLFNQEAGLNLSLEIYMSVYRFIRTVNTV